MKLPVNDRTRVQTDTYNWMLAKFAGIDAHGVERWEAFSHHEHAHQLLEWARRDPNLRGARGAGIADDQLTHLRAVADVELETRQKLAAHPQLQGVRYSNLPARLRVPVGALGEVFVAPLCVGVSTPWRKRASTSHPTLVQALQGLLAYSLRHISSDDPAVALVQARQIADQLLGWAEGFAITALSQQQTTEAVAEAVAVHPSAPESAVCG